MPKKSLNNIELRSEEVQEILSTPPHWMIRWGNIIFFSLMMLLLFLSWLVKYPETVICEAIVTMEIPPEVKFAGTSGKLDVILVSDNDAVTKDQPLAIIESTANYEDILRLKKVVDTIRINNKSFRFPMDELTSFSFGNIESTYIIFENNYIQYELNQKQQRFANNVSKRGEIDLVKEEMTLLKDVIESFSQLKKEIKDWESQYAIRSNTKGRISFLNAWVPNQKVTQGNLMFTILPEESSTFVAKLKTPVQKSGKIEKGQKVNVRLENYPDSEFGILIGTVKRISTIPNKEGGYFVDVDLPDKLITSKNKEIEFTLEMRASAEIITEDLRLL